MPKEEVTRLTVDIPAELHRRAKVFAAETGMDLRDVVTVALDQALPVRGGFKQLSPEVAKRLQPLRSILKKKEVKS